MYINPEAPIETVKKLKRSLQKQSDKIEQMNILKSSMSLAEAYKAVYGKDLEIDETDDNV